MFNPQHLPFPGQGLQDPGQGDVSRYSPPVTGDVQWPAPSPSAVRQESNLANHQPVAEPESEARKKERKAERNKGWLDFPGLLKLPKLPNLFGLGRPTAWGRRVDRRHHSWHSRHSRLG